jgi:hypothetical protein
MRVIIDFFWFYFVHHPIFLVFRLFWLISFYWIAISVSSFNPSSDTDCCVILLNALQACNLVDDSSEIMNNCHSWPWIMNNLHMYSLNNVIIDMTCLRWTCRGSNRGWILSFNKMKEDFIWTRSLNWFGREIASNHDNPTNEKLQGCFIKYYCAIYAVWAYF